MGKRPQYLMLAFVTLVLSSAVLFAQSSSSTVTGVVADASGGVVPGVEVTLTNTRTNFHYTGITDEAGRYRIVSVNAGPYVVKATLTGFKTAEASLTVTVSTVHTVNLKMEVGQISEVVQVTGAAQAVNTEEGRLSAQVDEKKILDLPLNGRNVFQLALLQPGVTQGRNSGIGGESGINANGNRTRGNNFSLDGTQNNDEITGGAVAITPNVDSVQEFRIQTTNFSAEFGRNAGSVINVVTKSGSNTFHGSAYDFLRNDALDAASVFAAITPLPGDPNHKNKAPLRQNQFGGTIGGPILKNKTFFFGSYEGFRTKTGTNRVFTLETKEFRDLVSSKFPGSIQAKLLSENPVPQPNKDLRDVGSPSSSVFDTGAKDGIVDYGELATFVPSVTNSDQWSIRIDHEWRGGKDKIYGRWLGQSVEAPAADLRNFGSPFDGYNGNANVSQTHIFSPKIVNEFRAGYSRTRSDFIAIKEQIPQVAFDDGVPSIGSYGGVPQFFRTNSWQYTDVLSINQGSHSYKAGIEFRRVHDNSDFQYPTRGYIEYNDIFDYAANFPYFMAIRVDPQTLSIVGTPRAFRGFEWGFFFQDDWKISRRLTINLGIRYDDYGQLNEIKDRLANIKLGQGKDILERIANASMGRVTPDGIWAPDKNNWAPRVGFAYDVFGNGKTSLRGGFGVGYDRLFLNVTGNTRFNPPDSAAVTFFQTSDAGSRDIAKALAAPVKLPPSYNTRGFGPRGEPVGQTVTLRSPDPSLRTSYAFNWFLGIQRELPGDMVFEINYTGSGGRKLGFIEQYNRFAGDRFGIGSPVDGRGAGSTGTQRLNPAVTSENFRINGVTSSYHGFNAQIQKRFSKGLTYQVAYTNGKVIDTSSDNFGGGTTGIFTRDPLNINSERGRAAFDVQHRLVTNWIWEIPFLKDQSGFFGQAFGGWQFQGIVTLQTGVPFTPICLSATCDYNGDSRASDRPNQAAFGNSIPPKTTHQFIEGVMKRADFEATTPGFFPRFAVGTLPLNGNLGRNTFNGPGFSNSDLSLFKNFRIPLPMEEDGKLQFRFELFNAFNRVNLNQVQSSITAGTFGRVNSASAARIIQMALKFTF